MDDMQLGKLLQKVWKDQETYNDKVKHLQIRSREEWVEIFLLGISSEFSEVLDELQWKRHRKSEIPIQIDRLNMADEFSDMMKYVISLFQLFDFTAEEMLEAVQLKTDYLETKLLEEFSEEPTPEQTVIICDLDGTLADYHRGYMNWLRKEKRIEIPDWICSGSPDNLHVDKILDMSYGDYYRLKDEFERTGGYESLPPYLDGVKFVKNALVNGAYLIVVTARPIYAISSVGAATWRWLQACEISPNRFVVGETERLLVAEKYKHHDTLIIEDDPGLAERAANIAPVLVRTHKYNECLVGVSKQFPIVRSSNWIEDDLSGVLNEQARCFSKCL